MTDLAARYGTRSEGRRRALVAVVVVVAAAGLSWLVWVMLVHGRPLAQSDINGFETVDQHRTTASFTVVRRDADVVASCLLRAFASDHSIVGELDVTVGAWRGHPADPGAVDPHRAGGHLGRGDGLHRRRPVAAPLTGRFRPARELGPRRSCLVDCFTCLHTTGWSCTR